MDNEMAGLTVIVSPQESFLAKGLLGKLKTMGVHAVLSGAKVKELEQFREHAELFVLFMGEDMDEYADAIVYIKDMAGDLDRRIIIIGDKDEHDEILKLVPDFLILEWFERPLDMEKLLSRVQKYLEENTGENAKKSVLIVDDDITYMRMIYEWLKDSYHVGMASSGVQAISYLARNKADLVLLDYEMPVANGPQVLEMLKNDSETDSIPVMFLTGHAEKEHVATAINLKPVDYLLKTIQKQELLDKIDTFFKKNAGSKF
ncbi:MAG: response regulator [Lachnospiraceae bacterium]|nr:response regulator [Lachnospiraceae bacterium]